MPPKGATNMEGMFATLMANLNEHLDANIADMTQQFASVSARLEAVETPGQ